MEKLFRLTVFLTVENVNDTIDMFFDTEYAAKQTANAFKTAIPDCTCYLLTHLIDGIYGDPKPL